MRILLTGVHGQLGTDLLPLLQPLGEVVAASRAECDLSSAEAIRKLVTEFRPDVIVNPAAYTAVNDAEAHPELAYAINATAPGVLAEEARKAGAMLVHYSTDYVFDGSQAGGLYRRRRARPAQCLRCQQTGGRACRGCRRWPIPGAAYQLGLWRRMETTF